ncbi:cytochrome c oxidase subunit 2 [Smittium mucronatum]|uniref:Cytochrome c oxidase polypeptide II n=1 Tax=Smittium mucronatum TaxID=133383 RepID=A0A1R0GL01_9FUNG|nr:cytochrome c oxidase subunit 2 [Smittium mucronatum]
MFYNNGKKVIPSNVHERSTPLALTVWIMDDGGWANYGIKIATNCFELKEVELLNETIKSKYNLETTVRSADYVDDTGETIAFDSFMIPTEDLIPGQFRLLEVDNRIVLPIHTHIRFISTSADVIHSFAVPSLGIKIDALPGRLNAVSAYVEREGVFYGLIEQWPKL